MNKEKADYGTVIRFGTLDDLVEKVKCNKDNLETVVNLVDSSGISLLEISLISRKFDISRFLLDNGAKVNVITKEGRNEFHYLSANIACEGAVEIGRLLLNEEHQ